MGRRNVAVTGSDDAMDVLEGYENKPSKVALAAICKSANRARNLYKRLERLADNVESEVDGYLALALQLKAQGVKFNNLAQEAIIDLCWVGLYTANLWRDDRQSRRRAVQTTFHKLLKDKKLTVIT